MANKIRKLKKAAKTRGRPTKFDSPQDFEFKVNEYFDKCDDTEMEVWKGKEGFYGHRPYTLGGLAYHLGMTEKSLYNYGKTEGYSDIYDMAKSRVEQNLLEQGLFGNYNPNIVKLILTASFGYKEQNDDAAELQKILSKYGVDSLSELINKLISDKARR